MRRSLSLVSILAIAGGLPLACSFSKATEGEIRLDASSNGVDIRLPPSGDGNNTFESDANVTCVMTNPMTTNLPPDVLIVLDRSGSMNDMIDGTACDNNCRAMNMSKWTQMTMALEAFIPTVETTVNWGLKLFATVGGNNSACNVSNTAEVAPRTMNANAIQRAIMGATAGSQTPTTAAITQAAAYLGGLNDGSPKFILLATDGIPTCGQAQCAPGVVTMGSQTQCDDANAIAAVKNVHDSMGIPTFVIGIGTATGGGDGTLTSMAQAGGYPRAGTPSYYPVQSAAELTDAFKTITGMVSSCFFAITPALKNGQTVSGVAAAGGVNLKSTDYMVVGSTGVQLVGQACTDFMAGTIKDIAVQVSCIL